MDLLSINQGMFFWSLIVFLVLVVILAKYAWKPILAAIDERESHINKSLDDADKARTEAEALLNEHKEMMQKSEDQAAEILKKSREQAEHQIEKAKEEAKAQAKDMIEKAQKAIEADKMNALQELRSEFAGMVVDATNKIIHSNLDAQKHQSLVDDYINKLPKDV